MRLGMFLFCLMLGGVFGAAFGAGGGAEVKQAGTREKEAADDLGAVRLFEQQYIVMKQTGGMGSLETMQDRIDAAFATLEKEFPGDSAAWEENGNFLIMSERAPDAFAMFQKAVDTDATNAEGWCNLGFAWTNRGDTRQGAACLTRAADIAPRDSYFHYCLGTHLYMFRHDLVTDRSPEKTIVDEALSELKLASQLAPQSADYARSYAETFYSIPEPKWGEALKAWQHFLLVTPNKDYGAINLARVSLLMDDPSGARKYLAGVNGSAYQGLKRKLLAKAGVSEGKLLTSGDDQSIK